MSDGMTDRRGQSEPLMDDQTAGLFRLECSRLFKEFLVEDGRFENMTVGEIRQLSVQLSGIALSQAKTYTR